MDEYKDRQHVIIHIYNIVDDILHYNNTNDKPYYVDNNILCLITKRKTADMYPKRVRYRYNKLFPGLKRSAQFDMETIREL